MNLLELLKQHYEKIILSVVLIGVIIAAAVLAPTVTRKKQELIEKVQRIRTTPLKPVQPVDLVRHEEAWKKQENPPPLNLSGGHNVINPVRWWRPLGLVGATGLIKEGGINQWGPDDWSIAKITSLYFRAEYLGPTGSGELLRYRLQLEDQCAATRGGRNKVQITTPGIGQRNNLFFMRRVEGAPDNPTSLIIEMVREKDVQITITPGKPFERVCGFEVNLTYPPENNKPFSNLRVGSPLTIAIGLGGTEAYKVIDIKESEVTVESIPTGKRTSIPLVPATPVPAGPP